MSEHPITEVEPPPDRLRYTVVPSCETYSCVNDLGILLSEGIDVFDMAQRTNLSVAGIFGPEHNLSLTEMPFASDMDSR